MSGAEATLKCIVAWSDRRNLCSLLEDAVQARVAGDVRRLGDDAVIVYTTDEPAEIRNWLRGSLDNDESVLVVEFERWSSYGPGVDSRWLLARGH